MLTSSLQSNCSIIEASWSASLPLLNPPLCGSAARELPPSSVCLFQDWMAACQWCLSFWVASMEFLEYVCQKWNNGTDTQFCLLLAKPTFAFPGLSKQQKPLPEKCYFFLNMPGYLRIVWIFFFPFKKAVTPRICKQVWQLAEGFLEMSFERLIFQALFPL